MSLPHGSHNLTWRKNILIVELKGCFNEEGMMSYISNVKNEISLQKQPFSILIDCLKFEGATAESFAALERYNDWLNNLDRLKCKVLVQESSIQKQIARKYIPALSTQKVYYFKNQQEAMNWLIGDLQHI